MTQKEQLYYLIKEYNNGNYQTDTFCDEFTRILCLEKDGSLSSTEETIFRKSDEVFARFSPYEEDVKSGYLFGEDRIQKEFYKMLDMLKIKRFYDFPPKD